MLQLPDYMRRVETKPRESNIVGSFLAGRKYAADEAYRQGQSQLAREKFEADKQYRAEQMDLQKQQFEASQKDKVINLQREQFNNLTARLDKSNLPFEEKERLINQQFDSMPEFKESLGNTRPILTKRNRLVYENSGVLTDEKLDSLGLPPDQRAAFEPNIGQNYKINFLINPDGSARLVGSPQFSEVKKSAKEKVSPTNFVSTLKIILEDPEYMNDMDAAVKETKRILGEFSDNKDLKTITDKKDKLLEFNSVEEVVSANLEPGTIVLINGREARVD